MDFLLLLRTLGGLLAVLGILAGALWVVRRYGLTLPGMQAPGTERRLAIVERLALDQRRSLALVSLDGREHLLLLGPEGNLVVERSAQTPAHTDD